MQLSLDMTEQPSREWRYNGDSLTFPLDDERFPERVRFNGRCRKCRAAVSLLVPAVRMRDYRGVETVSTRAYTARGTLTAPSSGMSTACQCGARVAVNRVQGNYDPGVRCDARCENATGTKCDCQCGGLNHGAAHG